MIQHKKGRQLFCYKNTRQEKMLQIYITTSTYNIFHIKKKHFLNVIIKIDKKKNLKKSCGSSPIFQPQKLTKCHSLTKRIKNSIQNNILNRQILPIKQLLKTFSIIHISFKQYLLTNNANLKIVHIYKCYTNRQIKMCPRQESDLK